MMASDKKRKKDRDDMATGEKIPKEVWDIIFQKLVDNSNLLDIIRFSAVCSMFRSITSSYPKSIYRLSSPFLLMPRHDSVTHDLFSMSDDDTPRIYPLSLPELQNSLCVGSSYGWLITVNLDSWDFCLLNPLNGAAISLPQLFCLGSPISTYRLRDMKHNFKASISTDPSTDGDFIVTATHKYIQGGLYLCRRGDSEWTCLEAKSRSYFQDFIGNMGGFYAIDDNENLLSWEHYDFEDDDAAKTIIKSRAISKASLLVNSPGGDLLMVHLKNGMYSKYRHQFSVSKLDKAKKKFVRVTRLVKEALLLGLNPSCAICVSTVECPQYFENCIYYTQHNKVFVYNMKDMTTKRVYKHSSTWQEPCIWVTPTTAMTYADPQAYDSQGER